MRAAIRILVGLSPSLYLIVCSGDVLIAILLILLLPLRTTLALYILLGLILSFDPDSSGVGTTVTCYSDLSAKYNNYIVHSSKIRWHVSVSQAGADLGPLVMCTCLDDDATTFLATGSWATQMSDPRCKAQRVTRNAKEKIGSGVITSRYNAKKFFLDVDNEVHGARFGYNPTVQAFYTMRLYSADGITVLSPFMLFVDVEYLVEAFNKKGPLSYYEGVV